MKKPYHYVRAWGSLIGSREYFIQDEIDRANATNAPDNAIFYSLTTKSWRTVSDVSDSDLKLQLIDEVKKYEGQ